MNKSPAPAASIPYRAERSWVVIILMLIFCPSTRIPQLKNERGANLEERRHRSAQLNLTACLAASCVNIVTHRTNSCRFLRGRNALSSLRKVCSSLMTSPSTRNPLQCDSLESFATNFIESSERKYRREMPALRRRRTYLPDSRELGRYESDPTIRCDSASKRDLSDGR
jgi:hypothetical protein